MRRIVYLLLAFIALLGSHEVSAQLSRSEIRKNNKKMYSYKGPGRSFKDKRYTAVGLTLNAFNYYGDIAPAPSKISTELSYTRPALGVLVSTRLGPRYALSATFTYGTLTGSDKGTADPDDRNAVYRYNRNLSFRNRIKELALVATFDLWENTRTYLSRVRWTPYAFAGVAAFHHNPQGKAPQFQVDGVTPLAEAGEWVDLEPLGTEGQYANLQETDANYGVEPYKLFQFAIPFGVGARFRLNQLMDFSVELGFRYTFTDYLDDVSRNYVDLGVFGDNELAKAMSYRSNELSEVAPLLEPRVSTVDGNTYFTIPGYGYENEWNWRGSKDDNDTYMTTTLKLTYIIGKTYNRAKFR